MTETIEVRDIDGQLYSKLFLIDVTYYPYKVFEPKSGVNRLIAKR